MRKRQGCVHNGPLTFELSRRFAVVKWRQDGRLERLVRAQYRHGHLSRICGFGKRRVQRRFREEFS